MPGLLAGTWGLWAYALWQVPAGGPNSADLLSGAALAVAALLAVAISVRVCAERPLGPGQPAPSPTLALRACARRTHLPRLRNPDAAGHVRPRAPSAHPSAA